jgi:hypothetical protein
MEYRRRTLNPAFDYDDPPVTLDERIEQSTEVICFRVTRALLSVTGSMINLMGYLFCRKEESTT